MTPETPIRLEFERPPLVEKASVLNFEPIEGFTIVDFGLFWLKIREAFPSVSTDSYVDAPTELFEGLRATGPQFQLLDTFPMPRAMFRNPVGELIQLQADRFGFNWTQIDGSHYPRSEQVMARFEELFTLFSAFLAERGLGPIKLKQCELTNLNVIPVSAFGQDFSDIAVAFSVDPLDLGLTFLRAETYVRSRQHRIVDEEGRPLGRLHTIIQPVFSTQDNSKAFKLELVARSAPVIGSMDDALRFFSIARNAVNGAFRATVTERMRELWGEQHV